MREHLVKSLVGFYRREMIAKTKNLKNRENPQGRLENYFPQRESPQRKLGASQQEKGILVLF